MLRRTSLVALTVLAAGCTDLSSFETACSEDPSQCEDASTDTFVETSSDETAPPDSASDTAIDDADAEPDTAVDTSLEDVGPETEPDAEPETLADAADSSSDASLDSSSDSGADAKSDASDTGSDASICTANAYSCSGAILRQCNATGTGYTNIVTCPSAATCSPSLKRCTACTPGAYSCTGATRVQCDTYGATTTTVATCATPELCTASTGATCKTPVCAVGEKRCGTKDVEICNAGRTGWTTSTACSVSCTSLTCLDVVEIAGARGGVGEHFCVRLSDATVRCWGYGGPAVDGVGSVSTFRKPVSVAGVASAMQLSLGGDTSGARLADGTIKLWGQQPDYSSAGPTTIAGLTGATSFSLGAYFGCAVVGGGSVKCWGANGAGQLGDGTLTDRFPPTLSATGLTGANSVSCGAESAFAMFGTDARAWGSPAEAMGVGLTSSPVTSSVLSFAGVSEIAGGVGFACARQSDGTVICSGNNDVGQLGNGTKTASASAVLVSGLVGVVRVSAGGGHACALTTTGKVYCWGYNASGQLGNGTKTDSSAPVLVGGISSATQIACAANTSCALLNDRTVRCWGSNAKGQLGANLSETTTPESTTPVVVVF